MRKRRDDFTISSILYELMQGAPTYAVADKYKLPYEVILKWEREYSTLWVLNT